MVQLLIISAIVVVLQKPVVSENIRQKRTLEFVLRNIADAFGYDVQKRPSILPLMVATQAPTPATRTFFPPPVKPLPPAPKTVVTLRLFPIPKVGVVTPVPIVPVGGVPMQPIPASPPPAAIPTKQTLAPTTMKTMITTKLTALPLPAAPITAPPLLTERVRKTFNIAFNFNRSLQSQTTPAKAPVATPQPPISPQATVSPPSTSPSTKPSTTSIPQPSPTSQLPPKKAQLYIKYPKYYHLKDTNLQEPSLYDYDLRNDNNGKQNKAKQNYEDSRQRFRDSVQAYWKGSPHIKNQNGYKYLTTSVVSPSTSTIDNPPTVKLTYEDLFAPEQYTDRPAQIHTTHPCPGIHHSLATTQVDPKRGDPPQIQENEENREETPSALQESPHNLLDENYDVVEYDEDEKYSDYEDEEQEPQREHNEYSAKSQKEQEYDTDKVTERYVHMPTFDETKNSETIIRQPRQRDSYQRSTETLLVAEYQTSKPISSKIKQANSNPKQIIVQNKTRRRIGHYRKSTTEKPKQVQFSGVLPTSINQLGETAKNTPWPLPFDADYSSSEQQEVINALESNIQFSYIPENYNIERGYEPPAPKQTDYGQLEKLTSFEDSDKEFSKNVKVKSTQFGKKLTIVRVNKDETQLN